MMDAATLPKRLSFGDAAFANFERPAMPMNVGSTGVYDGPVEFSRLVPHVERRINLVPRYRQRLMRVPFDLAFAAWVDDPAFDVRRHIEHVQLPAPGTREQLADLAGEFFSVPLSRDKPLWEIKLVDGFEGGRSAHLAKVHHCMVDGIGGVGLLAALLDFDPASAAARDASPPAAPPRAPGPLELAIDAMFDRWFDGMRNGERLLLALADPVGTLRSVRTIAQAFSAAGPYFAVPAPTTPWSMKLTRPRRLAWRVLRFADVRHVAKTLGGTINDVVLTSVGGALGRYLAAHGDPAGSRVLRAAVPVNVRVAELDGTLGNRVSFMLNGLPAGERDPVERFRAIQREAQSLKSIGQAAGVDALLRVLGAVPPVAQALLEGTLTLPNTLSNLVCTNVPGPLQPLYLMERRMVEHYPWVPLGWRMGMSVAVMSYDEGLYFSVTGDEQAPEDIGRIAAFIGEAFDELRDAVDVPWPIAAG